MRRPPRARSGGPPGDLIALSQQLLAVDVRTQEGARSVGDARADALLAIDLLASQDQVDEACELGLHLEEALERLGEPPGPRADEEGAGRSRFGLIEHLLGIARAAGHPYYEGEMLLRQAELWKAAGEREQAAGLYAAVADLAQAEDVGLLEVTATAGLAELAREAGNLFKAHGLYARQRAQAQALGEALLEAQAVQNLAATALAMGDYRRGARYAREGLALGVGLGDEQGQLEALLSLGLAQRHLGSEEEGRRSYREALRLARRLGNRAMEAAACYNLACLVAEGEPALAAALLDHAGALAAAVGAAALGDSCRSVLGRLAGRLTEAELQRARCEAPARVRELADGRGQAT